MTEASEYLIEITVHDGTGLKTLRISTSGYVTGPADSPANTYYLPGIQNPGQFARSLFDEGRTRGGSSVSYGMIEVANVDGHLDDWLGYGFDGRPLVVKRLAGKRASFSGAEVILRATVEGLDSSDAFSGFRLRLYDRRLELDKPLQANRYGGTTTSGGLAGKLADGTADMKDALKPLAFGRPQNVPAICVNPFDLIYQVNDGGVSAITVYDGGIALTLLANYATVAALQAATIPGGKYGTCLAAGLFRLGGAPYQVITADVTEGSTLALRNAGAIAQRMLTKLGLTGSANIAAATFTALSAAAPQELGIWINDDRSALDAVSAVLSSVGGFIVPNAAGAFEVGRLSAPAATSAWSITEDDIVGEIAFDQNPDTDSHLPAWRVITQYGRNYQTQDDGNLGACVSVERRGWLAREYREAKAENAAVQTKHLLAPEVTIETLMLSTADAAAEAARRLGLYGIRRDVLRFSLAARYAGAQVLNSTGTVTLGRLGYEAGRRVLVIGRREDPANEQVELTIWG